MYFLASLSLDSSLYCKSLDTLEGDDMPSPCGFTKAIRIEMNTEDMMRSLMSKTRCHRNTGCLTDPAPNVDLIRRVKKIFEPQEQSGVVGAGSDIRGSDMEEVNVWVILNTSSVTRHTPKVIHLHSRDMMSSEPIVVNKRSAPDAPDTSDDDGSQPERGKEAEAAGPTLDPSWQTERQRNKKLRWDGEARNLSREERKMTAIKWQIEEMEQTEKAEKLGQENGSGVETRNWDKRTEEVKHKQGSFEDKGKEEAVEKRKRPLTEEDNEAQKQQHEGVDGSRASSEPLGGESASSAHTTAKRPMFPMRGIKHVRASPKHKTGQTMQWTRHLGAHPHKKQCGDSSICEHNRQRSGFNECGGASIYEHNRIKGGCNQ